MFFDFLPITTGNIINVAVGATAIGTLVYLVRGFNESRRLSAIAINESKVRNRPWLRVTDCEFLSASKELVIYYTNGGTFPAYNLTITLRTEGSILRYSEDQIGLVFPAEVGRASLDFENPEDIQFTGSLGYFLGDQQYRTTFSVELTFEGGRITNLEWKNIEEETF